MDTALAIYTPLPFLLLWFGILTLWLPGAAGLWRPLLAASLIAGLAVGNLSLVGVIFIATFAAMCYHGGGYRQTCSSPPLPKKRFFAA